VEELKRTNEIKMAIPLLEAIDIQGKQVTADALLTQRKLADYLVRKRKAHYHFTVKANQPRLFQDIQLYFQNRQILLMMRAVNMDASKFAKFGPPPNSTPT
jgi:predicted transposase YbfD/YdcC